MYGEQNYFLSLCSFPFPYQSGIQALRSFSDPGKCFEMTLEMRISAKGEEKEKRKIHRLYRYAPDVSDIYRCCLILSQLLCEAETFISIL